MPLTAFELVLGARQDVLHTLSRRSQPAVWRRAVRWLVAARLHPKGCETTVRVADDLARRMDYLRGIAVYDLRGTARRLRISAATVKRHVAVLRELGALVWLIHGSRQNLRVPGQPYTATGTIYGAVIPPVFDKAWGHRLSGTDYGARVIGVTQAGRELAVAEAASAEITPVDNPPTKAVENPSAPDGSSGRAPHSHTCTGIAGKADVDGGLKDTPRARRSTTAPSASTPKKPQRSRRSARQAARDVLIARQVRARVQWTQTERLRRLAYVLRPWINAGRDVEDIVAELHSWWLDWRPQQPGSYIAAQINRPASVPDQRQPEPQPAVWSVSEAQTWQQPQSVETRRLVREAFHALEHRCADLDQPGTTEAGEDCNSDITIEQPVDVSDEDIAELRQVAWDEHLGGSYEIVTGALVTCPAVARRIYGRLVDLAEQTANSPTLTLGSAA